MKKLNAIFNKYKYYLSTSLLYFGSSLTVSIFGIVANPFLAKNLSHKDYTIIGYFTSFQLLLIPLVGFNLMTYYMRSYSRFSEDEEKVVSDTVLIGLIVIGFLSLAFFTIAFYFYNQWANVNLSFTPYALYALTQTYIGIFFTFYQLKLRLRKQAAKFALLTILYGLVTTSLTLLLVVHYKQGANGKLLAPLIIAIIFAIYSISKTVNKWKFDLKILKEALIFGLPLTISAIFWYFLTGVDRAMLEGLNDTYAFGNYSVAIQIATYLAIFYTAAKNTFEPEIYQAINDNNISRLLKLFGVVIGLVAIANLAFIFFAQFLIGILTANRYLESTPFAQILALQNITMTCYYMVIKLYIGYGYVKAELVVRIIGSGVSIAMFYILIKNYGFYGAAWGQVFSFLILSLLGLGVFFSIHKKYK